MSLSSYSVLEEPKWKCYRTELGSARPLHSKANLLTPGCGEGKYSVYLQGAKQGKQAARVQKTRTPRWLSGKGFLRPTFGARVAARGLSSDWLVVR